MSRRKIVIATKNKGKLAEMKYLLTSMNIEVISLEAFSCLGDIQETGSTFAENAILKAKEVFKYTKITTLADDSGLEVDFLNGEPGINSARFAGEPKDDACNNRKLLKLMEGVPLKDRKARFKCVIAIIDSDSREYLVEGTCEGIILEEMKGQEGFGYDPLFFLPELNKTFAELDMEIKNKLSHRGKAVKKAIDIFKKIFNNNESFGGK